MKPGGVLVVDTVLWQTVSAAAAALQRLGFRTETVQVQVNRSRPMPFGERLEAANPVWIVTAVRAGADEGKPIAAVEPDSEVGQAFHTLAERIAVDLRPKKVFSPELKVI